MKFCFKNQTKTKQQTTRKKFLSYHFPFELELFFQILPLTIQYSLLARPFQKYRIWRVN